MLRSSLIAALLLSLALGACEPKEPVASGTTPPTAPQAGTTNAPSDCAVRVEKAWIDQETPLRRYTAEASVSGPTCQQGVAVLTIRAREGSPIFTWSGPTEYIFGLKDAQDIEAMRGALLDWVDQSSSSMPTTANLPPWEETEGQPKRAEFPFHPEAGYDAASWEALRKSKLDMFCFPQGGESLDCAALRDGQMETVGLQQFPG